MPKLERRLRSQFQTRHDWHSCRVYRDTNQSIANTVWTVISFSHQRWDTAPNDDIWTAGSPDRLICRRAGVYQISGAVRWEPIFGNVRGLEIRLNNATIIAQHWYDAGDVGLVDTISTLYYLDVGDFVRLRVFQNAGVLNILSAGNYSPEFMMARVG